MADSTLRDRDLLASGNDRTIHPFPATLHIHSLGSTNHAIRLYQPQGS